jgi:hypothetical protein
MVAVQDLNEIEVECPYCGAPFSVLVDTSAGDNDYIEDCQVCCQPIEFKLQVGSMGEFQLLARREDDSFYE